MLKRKEEIRQQRQRLVSRSGSPLLRAYIASTSLQRLLGLFAYPPLSDAQALILTPCSAVHTFGFSETIDVAFLCAQGRILKAGTLKPWSMMICMQASSVIEMTEGAIHRFNLQQGQRLNVSYSGAAALQGHAQLSQGGIQ